MRFILLLSRLLVGILFIFSGLVKANDPLGLSYKMQEFFEVWGWHSFNDYTLLLSLDRLHVRCKGALLEPDIVERSQTFID